MAELKGKLYFKRIAALLITVPLLFGTASCSSIDNILGGRETHSGRTYSSEPSKPERGSHTSETTYETMQPTGTYPSETTVFQDLDYDYVMDHYVYCIWYDPTEDNPVYNLYFDSKDMFALKGVFYFSEPLTVVFEAKLYMNDDVLLTRQVKLNDKVTAEADFSAGLEGLGTFAPGTYKIELLYNGERVAITNAIEVT